MEHTEQVTGTLDRAGVLRVDVREGEEVVVGAGLLGLERPESGDEARLMEELAARRRLEQWITGNLEVRGVDRGRDAERVRHDVSKGGEAMLDLLILHLV